MAHYCRRLGIQPVVGWFSRIEQMRSSRNHRSLTHQDNVRSAIIVFLRAVMPGLSKSAYLTGHFELEQLSLTRLRSPKVSPQLIVFKIRGVAAVCDLQIAFTCFIPAILCGVETAAELREKGAGSVHHPRPVEGSAADFPGPHLQRKSFILLKFAKHSWKLTITRNHQKGKRQYALYFQFMDIFVEKSKNTKSTETCFCRSSGLQEENRGDVAVYWHWSCGEAILRSPAAQTLRSCSSPPADAAELIAPEASHLSDLPPLSGSS